MMFKVCFALSALLATALAVPWIAEPRDEHWIARHKHLADQSAKHAKEIEVVFLGASSMERWHESGRSVFEKHYGTRHVYNYGIGGDRTEHILWRLENKEFEGVNPKVIALLIGNVEIFKLYKISLQ